MKTAVAQILDNCKQEYMLCARECIVVLSWPYWGLFERLLCGLLRDCYMACCVRGVVVIVGCVPLTMSFLRLVSELKRIAQEKGCYKTILDCTEKNAAFYEKCGFKRKEIQMRFDHH